MYDAAAFFIIASLAGIIILAPSYFERRGK